MEDGEDDDFVGTAAESKAEEIQGSMVINPASQYADGGAGASESKGNWGDKGDGYEEEGYEDGEAGYDEN